MSSRVETEEYPEYQVGEWAATIVLREDFTTEFNLVTGMEELVSKGAFPILVAGEVTKVEKVYPEGVISDNIPCSLYVTLRLDDGSVSQIIIPEYSQYADALNDKPSKDLLKYK